MIMKFAKEFGGWAAKSYKSVSKLAPKKIEKGWKESKKYTLSKFDQVHKSNFFKKASHSMSEMSAMQVREVGKKFTTKTGIGISAGVAGGTVGYMAGKKKKKNRYYA